MLEEDIGLSKEWRLSPVRAKRAPAWPFHFDCEIIVPIYWQCYPIFFAAQRKHWHSALVTMLEGQDTSQSNEANEGSPSSSTRLANKKETKASSSRAPKTLSTAAKRYQNHTDLRNIAHWLLNAAGNHSTTIYPNTRTSKSHKKSLFATHRISSSPSRARMTPSYHFICILTLNSSCGHPVSRMAF